jgi:nucleotide-binding universal stress UspA family protein
MVSRILAGVDGSEGFLHALAWAVEEARLHKAVVRAVIVWQCPPGFGEVPHLPAGAELARRSRERLGHSIAAVVGQGCVGVVEPHVLDGGLAATPCKQPEGYDLVVGSRGHGAFARLLLGSVSSKCAHHGPCPVAIVPSGSE